MKLNKLFTERRANKHRVTGRWLKATMKHIMRKDFKDMDLKKMFKDRWLRAFCRRFRISWQKRTNQKNKGVLERMNTAKRYHWWIVYQMGTERPHGMILEPKKKQEHILQKKKKKVIGSKKKKKVIGSKKKKKLTKKPENDNLIPPPLFKLPTTK